MSQFFIQLEAAIGNPEPAAPFDYNTLSNATAAGLLIADIKDNLDAPTGLTFTAITPFVSSSYSVAAADVAANDRPVEVLRTVWFTSNGGTSIYQLGGLTAGDTYSIVLGGNNGNTRDTQYTVNGVTGDYIDGPAATPTDGTEFTGVVPENGIITIEITVAATGSFYGYLDSISGTITSSAIPAADPSDTITLTPPTGFTEVIASAQAATITKKDWAYVEAGVALDVAVTPGVTLWAETTAGVTHNPDGTTTIDGQVYAGGSVQLFVQDSNDTLIWSEVNTTFEAETGADITPDVPDLGADVTGVEPSAYITRSFVSSGITTSIAWTATGSAELSLSPTSGFSASVNAANGITVYVRLQADSTFGGVISGGVAGDSFSVTTRAQAAPVLTSIRAINVTVGTPLSYFISTQGGDPATTRAIVGGADAASYTLSNAGLLVRTSLQNTISSEVIQHTATNAAGVSEIQTLTINYVASTSGILASVVKGIRAIKLRAR